MSEFDLLLAKVRACTICASQLSAGVRPVLQIHPHARLLVAGQAPGRKVHQSGVPFDDASGERLREWMGVSGETFYDAQQIAILPMGFCFPGTGKSGDAIDPGYRSLRTGLSLGCCGQVSDGYGQGLALELAACGPFAAPQSAQQHVDAP
jgi:uracil-DNA glycosylase